MTPKKGRPLNWGLIGRQKHSADRTSIVRSYVHLTYYLLRKFEKKFSPEIWCGGLTLGAPPWNFRGSWGAMRDIRGDLEERAEAINDQIQAAYGWFEKTVQQLERQRNEQVAELKEVHSTLSKLIQLENASINNVVTLESPRCLTSSTEFGRQEAKPLKVCKHLHPQTRNAGRPWRRPWPPQHQVDVTQNDRSVSTCRNFATLCPIFQERSMPVSHRISSSKASSVPGSKQTAI